MSSSTERASGAFRAELPAVGLLRKLTQLSRAVAQAASLDEILQLAASQAAAILGADQALLMLVGDDGLAHVRASEGVDPALIDGLSVALDESLIARVEKALVGQAERAFMAVPLIVQGEVTGLVAVTRAGLSPWSAEEEAALAAIADQSAAPIEIARLTEEVRQARLIAENARLSEAEREARTALEAERARLATRARQLARWRRACRGTLRPGHFQEPDGGPAERAGERPDRQHRRVRQAHRVACGWPAVRQDRMAARSRRTPGRNRERRGNRDRSTRREPGHLQHERGADAGCQRDHHRGRHHDPRRHPQTPGGGASASGAADGGGGPAGWGGGARGQQPDERRARRLGLHSPAGGPAGRGPKRCGMDQARRRANGSRHRPAAGLRTPAGPASPGVRSQRVGPRLLAGPSPHSGRGDSPRAYAPSRHRVGSRPIGGRSSRFC